MSPCRLLFVSLLQAGLACSVLAEPAQPTAVPAGKGFISGAQVLERDKTIVWLEALLKDLMPKSQVELVPGQANSIVLKGNVAWEEEAEQIMRIIESQRGAYRGEIVNALCVGEEPRHIQIDVAIVLTTDLCRRQDSDPHGIVAVKEPHECAAFLQSLCKKKSSYTMQKHRLLAVSGQKTYYHGGGQQTVPTRNEEGEVSVAFIPFGTLIWIEPVVLKNGKIFLEAEIGASSIDKDAGVNISGIKIHGRREQRQHTSCELADGQTFITSGGKQTETRACMLPYLQMVPQIGPLLSRCTQWCEIEREMILLLTPRLIP